MSAFGSKADTNQVCAEARSLIDSYNVSGNIIAGGDPLRAFGAWCVVSQSDKQNLALSVTALRAESYSAHSGNIVISLRTKYSANAQKYSIPVECFRDLISDLQRLDIATTTPIQPDQPTERAQPLLPEISIISE